jgi:hypothetical protein
MQTPEEMRGVREVVIKAASIANDYIQGLGDQSRNSEILGRDVQKAILDSVELDLQAKAYRALLLDEAAEKLIAAARAEWFRDTTTICFSRIERAMRDCQSFHRKEPKNG